MKTSIGYEKYKQWCIQNKHQYTSYALYCEDREIENPCEPHEWDDFEIDESELYL